MYRRLGSCVALAAGVLLVAVGLAGFFFAPTIAHHLPRSWSFTIFLGGLAVAIGYVLDRIDRKLNPRRGPHFFVLPRKIFAAAE